MSQVAQTPMRSVSNLVDALCEVGAKPVHVGRIMRAWLQGNPLDHAARRFAAEHHLPARLREALPGIQAQLDALVQLERQAPSQDGSARHLLRLLDRQSVESVSLPREGVCVSTQVGCAVGCTFCMTGRSGLLRQLGSAEILAQVVLARRQRPVRKVVFMGMGEPAHNLDNVLEAIHWLATAAGIGQKQLVFSTVGDPRVFERLAAAEIKPALALSLHSSIASRRRELLPNAAALVPDVLVEEGERYARLSGYPIQYQWTLLAGINDSDEELDGLVRLLKGKYAMLNFIPYNPVEGLPYRRPDPERLGYMAGTLHQNGIVTAIRQSAGQDVDGGCGQLRARHLDGSTRLRRKGDAAGGASGIIGASQAYPTQREDMT